MSDELAREIAAIRQGDHLCMIYENAAEQLAAAVPFIKDGLARGERCVYIADDRTAEEIASALAAAGVDVAQQRERGALLLLTKRETYLRSGEFDPEAMIDCLRQAVKEAQQIGFAGFRVTGEMTWALGPEVGCDRLIEYEARLSRFSPGSRASAICQYNRQRFSPEIIRGVLRTHPVAILGKQVCPNPSYEPAELVLGPDRPADRVEWMIAQLKRARATEQQLEKYNQVLIEQATALAEAHHRKDEFLAMLGHELRNPLAPIRNAVQLIRMLGLDHPQLQWARDVIDRQVRHLSRLVDDLLDMSRITRGKIHLQKEPVDLTTVVSCAVETSRPLIEARRHELTISLPPGPVRLEADAARLAQALANLLHNAAKFTPEGGHIWLTVELLASGGRQPPDYPATTSDAVTRSHAEAETKHSVTEHGFQEPIVPSPRPPVPPSHVMIRVRDNGIGIPAELLPHVFDLFTQADRSLDRSQGGLGIGLTLARKLIELHGGTVQAQSEGPSRGSEFIVCLPVLPEVQELREGMLPGKGITASSRRRVLVVDDNIDLAESLVMLLQMMGHEVHSVHDGPAALEAARAFRPDWVLLDIGLPGMNGYEVARQLRDQPELRHVQLVALTGYGRDEDYHRSREAGFQHHLVKPVGLAALQALLMAHETLRTVPQLS